MISRGQIALVLVGVMLGVSGLASDSNGRGRHKKMYAVPAPGAVVIDGKLGDWDLSGQIEMYVIKETSAMQSAKFALMYDKDALYISGAVRDPNPMMNRHDPKVDAHKGWDADACQFRIVVDPAMGYPVRETAFTCRKKGGPKDTKDAIKHLLLWYYTDRREACLQLHMGMGYRVPRPEWAPHGLVPLGLYGAKYVKADDGCGYTFEYRVPWSTLDVKQPAKGGDLVAGTVQFNWRRPDGLKTAGGSAWAYDVMSGPGFAFQSAECWGKIIFSEKGDLPKELVEEGIPPEKPMPLEFSYGVPEDSEVTVQLLDDQGQIARTLVASGERRAGKNVERWDGLDDTGQPLAAGEYAWKGLYHRPIKTKFILSVHNSGQPLYKLDNNRGGWGGDHGMPSDVCAVGEDLILTWNSCESGWGIIRVDQKGRKKWGNKHNALVIASDGKRLFTYGGHGFHQAPGVKVFDLRDGRPLNWGNKSPYLSPPEGGEEGSNHATGLAYHRGTVYASYGKRDLVATFDAKTGDLKTTWPVPKPGRLAVRPDGTLAVISDGKVLALSQGNAEPLCTDHLDQPVGVAVDTQGNVYVANRGELQNVSVFTADGKFQRSIGKKGGRPRVGRFDRAGILEPGGIAIDGQGRLWVAETLDAPKRHSVWDTATGKCVAEFFGGSAYFGWAYMDPKHPDEVYCHNTLWKVDLDKGTWHPHSTIWRGTTPNMIKEPNPNGYAGHFRVMTAKNGKQFGWGMSDYSNMLFMREGDIFKPIAGTIRVAFGAFGGGLRYPVMKEFHEKHKAPAYLWQDANDDQTVQPDELVVSPANRGEQTFNWIDEELNAWCDAGFIFKPVRIERSGRPIYDFSKYGPIPFKGGNANATSLWLDPDDEGVYTLNPGRKPSLAKWTRDGKLVWAYPKVLRWNKALNLPVVTPGKLWGLTMPLGVAGDFIGAATYFNPYHIFTRDGLYVAMVMRDGRTGGLGADITASETITGQLVKPEGMDRYFLLAGDQDGRVTEILGLDTVRRLPGGRYVHREEAVAEVVAAQKEYARLLAQSQRLEIVRGRQPLLLSKGITKSIDSRRGFTVRAAYDADNFYVAYDVKSPFELINAAPDDHTVFKGGNLLDIQIATDPKADPKRKKPAPGDVRILISRQKAKPFAVVYRPKVAGFAGQPIVLTSPTGKEPFDSIERTDNIELTYRKRPGGFQAIAAIPLSLLGWQPKPGQQVRLDVGYIFGNKPGTQVALRAYWMNNSFSANVTADIPNESRLEPHEWGTAVVE